jgi:hypothetical protein
MEEEKLQYEHPSPEKNSKSFNYDFPLDHPGVTLNRSIEDSEEFQKFMSVLSDHKESLSYLTVDGGDAMITE